MCFTVEERPWRNVKTPISHCADWTQKYAHPSHVFLLWTVFVVFLLGWVRDPELCWCRRTASLHGWLLVHYLSNGLILLVMSVSVFKHFIPSIFNCLCIVRKHLAQTCYSITPADLQTFYQRFVFDGKTHIIHAQKYHIRMTSPVGKNIKLFYW